MWPQSASNPSVTTSVLSTAHEVPIPFVHGDATAPTHAHPTDLIPSLAAFCTSVEAFHFARAAASLRLDTYHGSWFIVVNINALF
jgi:hypothetical protein